MLLYLYSITLCKCMVILFAWNCSLSLTACPLVTKIRISNIVVVYIDAVSIHSFIYIFSKISYKKKMHLQMSIRIGYECCKRISYWFYPYYVYLLHRMFVFTKCTSIRMLKAIRFSAITAVTCPSMFYE
jgi:hypothetical protein